MLERYIAQFPKDVQALSRLVALYQSAQRPKDYLQTLEILVKLAPTLDRYRELSKLYSFYGNPLKQIQALRQIVKYPGTSIKTFIDLANLLATQTFFVEAVETLEQAKEKFPLQVDQPWHRLYAQLILDAKQSHKALAYYTRQLEKDFSTDNLLEIAQQLHYAGTTAQALQLLKKYPQKVLGNQQLLGFQIELLIASQQSDQAFNLVTKLSSLILPESVYLDLLEVAQAQKNARYADWLRGLPLAEKNKIPLVFAYITETKDQINPWLSKIDPAKSLTVFHLIKLATLHHQHHNTLQVRHLLNQLPPAHRVDPTYYYQLTQLFIQINDSPTGFRYFRALDPLTNPETLYAWGTMAILAKKIELVTRTLSHQVLPFSLNPLSDLYYLASENHHFSLAALFGASLWHHAPSMQHLLITSDALGKAKKFASAATLLQKFNSPEPALNERYFEQLASFYPHDKTIRRLLRQFLTLQFQQPHIPARQLPTYFSLAQQCDVSTQLIAPHLATLARNKSTPDAQKRTIAYDLMASAPNQAIDILFALAKGQGPNNPDLQELLNIWGTTAPPWFKTWLETQVTDAPLALKSQWLKHLFAISPPAKVVPFWSSYPYPDLISYYVTAFNDPLYRSELPDFLRTAIPLALTPTVLNMLGQTAQDHQFSKLAISGYQRSLQLSADQPDVLQALAQLYFDANNHGQAEPLLQQLTQQYPAKYPTQLMLAEIKTMQNQPDLAQIHYRQALSLLRDVTPLSVPQQREKIYILWRLGKTEEALTLFESLYQTHKSDKMLELDYLEFLLEIGQLNKLKDHLF